LPMIDILASGRTKARMPRSLILEPTRELAAQVAESFEKYGKNNKLSKALLIGGVSFADQVRLLDRGVDVLIATPGRLLDHFERGKLMLNGVQILVIDEADRMLDMGFIPDVERICKLVTQKPQTLFFSATMPPPIKRLTDRFLDDPKMIEVAPQSMAAETVAQKLFKTSPRDKGKALERLLADPAVTNALVFCNRKVEVSAVYLALRKTGMNVAQLHGDMAQADRMDVLQRFKDHDIDVLIASDVAARGLDIPRVSHVFNYDVPINPEDYVHRIGRTGRAGRAGISITLATPRDAKAMAAISRLIGTEPELISLDGRNSPKPAPKSTESTPPQQETRPESRRRKRGPRRQGRAAAPAAGPQPKPHPSRPPEQAQAGHRDDPDPASKPQRHERQKHNKHKDIRRTSKPSRTPVVGLGDHVPDFMKGPSGKD
ncbi:MAG: DEAD/DEAH box helicase, partial [Sphingomonadales bacterium]